MCSFLLRFPFSKTVIFRKHKGDFQCRKYSSKPVSNDFLERKEIEKAVEYGIFIALKLVYIHLIRTIPSY